MWQAGMSQTAIAHILRESGPLTGAELLERSSLEVLELWRLCLAAPGLSKRIVGRRFLRLDRAIDGYARLSPSIRREFLTYTVLGLSSAVDALEEKAGRLAEDISRISAAKRRLAKEAMTSATRTLRNEAEVLEQICFILAGDITYDMAHRVPRPEHSTGKMVRGSDLDVVVIVRDGAPPSFAEELDAAIYQKKHFYLISPSYREEIDYLIKRVSAVRRQVAFDSFEAMVACKIMVEGELLHGSPELHREIWELLKRERIPDRLAELEARATRQRGAAEESLRDERAQDAAGYLNLFYTTEEGDEIY
jgi:hypothetical protein